MANITEEKNTVYVVDAITQTQPNEQLIARYLHTQSTIAFLRI